jgi:hypothetical protein
VVRPYKTRTAFAASSTIYLNEHLIDNEEIVEYLILREMICIKLNMYRSRYSGLTYAAKFDDILHFFMPKEKVEEIREKMEKLIEVNRRLRQPLFPLFYGAFRRRLVLRGWGEELLRRDNVDKRKRKKEVYSPADTSLGIRSQV